MNTVSIENPENDRPGTMDAGELTTSTAAAEYRAIVRASFRTPDILSPLIIRLALAVTMFPHGAQKALGWFGGAGLINTIEIFHRVVGVPPELALLDVLAEFVGSIFLAIGLFTRASALSIGAIMMIAVVKVHWRNGFFMNWTGLQHGEGFEFFIPVLGIILVLAIRGGGRWSLDRLLFRKMSPE